MNSHQVMIPTKSLDIRLTGQQVDEMADSTITTGDEYPDRWRRDIPCRITCGQESSYDSAATTQVTARCLLMAGHDLYLAGALI